MNMPTSYIVLSMHSCRQNFFYPRLRNKRGTTNNSPHSLEIVIWKSCGGMVPAVLPSTGPTSSHKMISRSFTRQTNISQSTHLNAIGTGTATHLSDSSGYLFHNVLLLLAFWVHYLSSLHLPFCICTHLLPDGPPLGDGQPLSGRFGGSISRRCYD